MLQHLVYSTPLLQDAYVPQALRPNVRVTLQMGAEPTEMTLQQPSLGAGRQVLFGQLAKPLSPKETEGTYWGYTTRLASTISQVFKDGPYGVRDIHCLVSCYDVLHMPFTSQSLVQMFRLGMSHVAHQP